VMKRLSDVIGEQVNEFVAIKMHPSAFRRVVKIVSVEVDHFAVRAANGDMICVPYHEIFRVVSHAKHRVIGGIIQKRTKIGCVITLSNPTANLGIA
jgi:hypothetical protein